MRRRAVLLTTGGALVGPLAGCNNSTDEGESPTPSAEAPATPTATSTTPTEVERQRTVDLDSQDTVPETHQVSIAVAVLESAITTAQTARLRVTMTNEGSKRAFRVAGGYCKLFTDPHAGSDDPAGLWLYQPDETKHLDRKGERWVPDRPPSEPRTFPASACSPQEYASGESVSTEYEVWDDYQVEGYLKPDTYRWEQEVGIWEDSDARATEPPTATFTWGFALSVEKAD